MADRYGLLTLYGRDRPGIVARVARILYEIGCNIEDSSMTRLRGEFTILLILRFPDQCDCQRLEEGLNATVREMELFCHLRELQADLVARPQPAAEGCVIHVLGADKPGIVYGVTRLLEEEGGNITDLQTQVVGTPQQPIYAMLIEASLAGDLAHLSQRMAALARDLGVEIAVRANDTLTL